MKKAKGFTIVELLIVILVIGILAAVTLVAYSAVQQRSHNAKTAQAVREYLNALTEFYGENGRYPSPAKDGTSTTPAGYNGQCLGNDYASNVCWNSSYAENSTMNNLLSSILGSALPMPYISGSSSGILYLWMENQSANTYWTVDGKPTDWLVYSMEGSGACPVGPVAYYGITYTGGTANPWMFSVQPPSTGQTTPGTCWIPLTP